MAKSNGGDKKPEHIFVGSIFGKETQDGLVVLEVGEKKVQLTIEEARKVAYDLLECAESAETDAMCYAFGLDAGDAMVGIALIKFFRDQREQRSKANPRR